MGQICEWQSDVLLALSPNVEEVLVSLHQARSAVLLSAVCWSMDVYMLMIQESMASRLLSLSNSGVIQTDARRNRKPDRWVEDRLSLESALPFRGATASAVNTSSGRPGDYSLRVHYRHSSRASVADPRIGGSYGDDGDDPSFLSPAHGRSLSGARGG